MELIWLLGVSLGLLHFLGEEIEERIEGRREKIVSFGAGVSISYVFFQMIPEFSSFDPSRLLFAFPLIGFSSIHLAEKYVQKADISLQEARKEFAELHSLFLFFYHSIIGYLLANFFHTDFYSSLLFFVPVAFHTAFSSFSITELDDVVGNDLLKVVLSSAPLLGIAVYSFTGFSSMFQPVYGLFLGSFLYIVVRDSIPSGGKGAPVEYVLGVLVYFAVIFPLL